MKWIKIILICFLVYLTGCKKVILNKTEELITTKDVFAQSTSVVENGQDIDFQLQTGGKYILVLFDSSTNNVVSMEKFRGLSGNNTKKIYTNSFNQKKLYLLLRDSVGNQINKTIIIIK